MDDNKFWLVWNAAAGVPRVKHTTEEAAYAEAQRLAANNPGKHFYVLEAQAFVVRTSTTTVKLK